MRCFKRRWSWPYLDRLVNRQLARADFTIGNTDTVRKRLLVLVHDFNSSDLAACSFWLDAGQASSTAYTMRMHTTDPWTDATVSF